MKRLFAGSPSPKLAVREMAAEEVRIDAAEDGHDLIELEVVGEGYRQDALAAIAGPKDIEGKREPVGVTLRCEPKNEHDPNAVRVEVMGQLLGYVKRSGAEALSPAMLRACGGALEARGLIVGGWLDEESEGHYGIRVWITQQDAQRLDVRADALDPNQWQYRPKLPEPEAGERRLSATGEQAGSMVTVTCEEHYQSVIEAAMPEGWNPAKRWPLLVDLAVAAANPHTKHGTPCVEVRVGVDTLGYFTPKMSERHLPAVRASIDAGERPTARAEVARESKGDTELFQITVNMHTTG